MVLSHPGSLVTTSEDGTLYFPASTPEKVQETPTSVKLIPYYAWDNRELTAMQVWIPYTRS